MLSCLPLHLSMALMMSIYGTYDSVYGTYDSVYGTYDG